MGHPRLVEGHDQGGGRRGGQEVIHVEDILLKVFDQNSPTKRPNRMSPVGQSRLRRDGIATGSASAETRRKAADTHAMVEDYPMNVEGTAESGNTDGEGKCPIDTCCRRRTRAVTRPAQDGNGGENPPRK